MTKILNREMPKNIEEIYNKIKQNLFFKYIVTESQNGRNTCEQKGNVFHIKIMTNLKEYYFWEIFLHELLHIIQTQEGYRNLRAFKDSDLVYIVNNAIMDIDVNRRLKHQYQFDRISVQGRDNLVSNIIRKINICQENNKCTERETKILAVSIAYVHLCFEPNFAKALSKSARKLNSNYDKYYNGFISVVNAHPDINKTQVSQIQKEAIRLFDLKAT